MIDVADLQGGIVRGYGQRFGFARHLFARVREPRAARAFLAALADPVTTEEEWARHPEHDAQRRALAPRARGARAAGMDPRRLPGGVPRGHGGARRAASATTPAAGSDDLRDLEVLLVVHAQSAEALEAEAGRWERALRAAGQRARARPRAAGRRCSASSASTSASPTASRSRPSRASPARTSAARAIPYKRAPWWPLSRTRWRAVKPGEFVLGYEDEDRGPRARAARALRPQRELHGVAQAPPGRRRLPRAARRAGAAPGPRRGARRGQARRALARRQPAGRCAPTAPTRRWATTSERANDFRYGDDPLGPALPARRPRAAHQPARRARLGGPADRAPPDPAPRDALRPGPARGRRRTTARRAGCSSSACRPRSRASSRSSSRSGATTATRSAWAARPTRSAGPPAREVRHIIEGDPPRVAAPLRSYVECRGGEYLVVPSISALRALPALCTRAVTKRRRRATNTHGAVGRLEHRSTPSHAPGSDQPWSQAMTSREHARRLMLILLTSEGTALRKAADDRMLRREQTRPRAGVATASGGPEAWRSPGRRASAASRSGGCGPPSRR